MMLSHELYQNILLEITGRNFVSSFRVKFMWQNCGVRSVMYCKK